MCVWVCPQRAIDEKPALIAAPSGAIQEPPRDLCRRATADLDHLLEDVKTKRRSGELDG